MKRRKLGKLSLVLTVLLIGLGYAAVSTTLSVNGTATIGPSDFDVVFDAESLSGTNTPIKNVSSDGRTLTFETSTLKDIGDTATVTYKIKNNSQYGAAVDAVTCSSVDSDYSYLQIITPTETTVEKNGTSSDQTITVKLTKSYAEETAKSITFTCTMDATATAA